MGAKIRERRLELGVSQTKLAEKVGVSRMHIIRLETGTCENPTRVLMLKIANALGSNVTELFFQDSIDNGMG